MGAIDPRADKSILDHCLEPSAEISLERYGATVVAAWTGYQAQLLGGVAESVAEAAYAAKLRAAWHKYRSVVEPLPGGP